MEEIGIFSYPVSPASAMVVVRDEIAGGVRI